MNIKQSIYIPLIWILICACNTACMDQINEMAPITIVKQIELWDGNEFCGTRRVWIPSSYEKIQLDFLLPRGELALPPREELAPKKLYKIITNMQEKLGINYCPCTCTLISNIYDEENASMLVSSDNKTKKTILYHIRINKTHANNEAMLKYLIGHTLSHIKDDTSLDSLHMKYETHQNYAITGAASYITSCIPSILTLGYPQYKDMLFPLSLVTFIGGCTTLAYNYHKASCINKQFCDSEIRCDAMAVELGTTAEEKIYIAEAGKRCHQSLLPATYNHSRAMTWRETIEQCLVDFPPLHADPTNSIKHLQKLIDENKAIIAQRNNL